VRRVKGVAGAVRLRPASSSSTAVSSIESELLVDMLERRMLNDALGELPRPIVEMESLRPLSVLIAVEIGPGNGGGWEMELLRNMLARPLTEPRLWRAASLGLLLPLSEDMMRRW
jgi:hypothetical protein